MSVKNPFSLEEAISTQYQTALPSELKIKEKMSNEAKLIRLLLGTLKVNNIDRGEGFVQRKNYSLLGITENTRISTKPIKEFLKPDYKLDQLNDYFLKYKYENNNYYDELILEYNFYFYNYFKGQHTLAFFHLYRILEYVSYTFPLIYTSVSSNYKGSYNSLKNYFSDSNSELKFFQIFLNELFEDEVELETPLTLSFLDCGDLASKHYSIYKKFLKKDDIISLTENSEIEIQYGNLLNLCITLRNRFFHFAVGGKENISSTDIINSDVFFKIIIEDGINWISFIYLQIFKIILKKSY